MATNKAPTRRRRTSSTGKKKKTAEPAEAEAEASAEPTAEPAAEPAATPTGKSAAKAQARPTAKPAAKPTAKPEVQARPEPEKPAFKSPLAERAGPPARELSAKEAVHQAMLREGTAEPAPARRAAPASHPPPADAAEAIVHALPGVTVVRTVIVEDRRVFSALWQAHRAAAHATGNLALAATASVLLNASRALPPGQLVAAEIAREGHSWAVWVDATSGTVLGVAQPTSVYLAGIC